jgi:hypothetical protein
MALKSFQPILDRHLDTILERLFAQVPTPVISSDVPGGEDSIALAKQIQVEHWVEIFRGLFDLDYVRGVKRMGLLFVELGLEPRWYVAECASLTSELLALCLGRDFQTEAESQQMCKAITKAVMFDVDYTLSVWNAFRKDSSARSFSELLSAFEKDVLPRLDGIGMTTNALVRSLVSFPFLSNQGQADAPETSGCLPIDPHPAKAVANSAALFSSLTHDNFKQPSSAKVPQNAPGSLYQCSHSINHVIEASKKLEQVGTLIQRIAGQIPLLMRNKTIKSTNSIAPDSVSESNSDRFACFASHDVGPTNASTDDIANTPNTNSGSDRGFEQHAIACGEISEQSTPFEVAAKQPESSCVECVRLVQRALVHDTGLPDTLQGTSVAEGAEVSANRLASSEAVLNHAKELAQNANQLRMSVSSFIQSMRSNLGHS